MYLIRRNLLSRNCSKQAFNHLRPFCSTNKQDDKINESASKSKKKKSSNSPVVVKENSAINKSSSASPAFRPLTSAVVLKSPTENKSQDENIDFHLSIKNLEKYDDDSQVVYDITDEQLGQDEEESKFKYLYQNRMTKELMLNDPKLTQRGKEGVFDLDQLVYALEKEKIQDIAVIRIPDDIHINKCFVIGSAKSAKHLKSVFEYIEKLYKIKMTGKDKFPHKEGVKSNSWKILDMDIIMLHLFLKEKREFYDIEQLWTVGSEFDDKCRVKKDKLEELVEEHAKYLEEKQRSSEEKKTDEEDLEQKKENN